MKLLTAILAVAIFAIAQYVITRHALNGLRKRKEKRTPRIVIDRDYNIGMTCARCGADFVEVDGKLKCPRCTK